jgi:hypothetical protein
LAPIVSNWLDNHIGFTVMQRFPGMKVVMAHGKASWMEEVLEKMEASSRVIPLLHKYPVRTDTEEMWEEGKVMLGFDAEERTTSAHDAVGMLARADAPEDILARMMGGNAAAQFNVEQLETVT